MIQSIDREKCIGCSACRDHCPLDTIRIEEGKAKIAYPEDCMSCYLCEENCPAGAIYVHPYKKPFPSPFPGIAEGRKML